MLCTGPGRALEEERVGCAGGLSCRLGYTQAAHYVHCSRAQRWQGGAAGPQAWVGGSSLTPATHTGSVATSVSGKQLPREEGQTLGCHTLHSQTCHFRRLQTRFVRAMWLRPHGGTGREGCMGNRAARRKEWRCADGTEMLFTDNCLCKQFDYQS